MKWSLENNSHVSCSVLVKHLLFYASASRHLKHTEILIVKWPRANEWWTNVHLHSEDWLLPLCQKCESLCEIIHVKMISTYRFIFIQFKLIFMKKKHFAWELWGARWLIYGCYKINYIPSSHALWCHYFDCKEIISVSDILIVQWYCFQ